MFSFFNKKVAGSSEVKQSKPMFSFLKKKEVDPSEVKQSKPMFSFLKKKEVDSTKVKQPKFDDPKSSSKEFTLSKKGKYIEHGIGNELNDFDPKLDLRPIIGKVSREAPRDDREAWGMRSCMIVFLLFRISRSS